MLVRRVVTRPGNLRFQQFQLQKQFQRLFTLPSGSQLQALPRPNTWLAKLRFRADGKPRSKLIASGFGSLILIGLLSSFILIRAIQYDEATESLLIKMLYARQTDAAYDSVNFDDLISTLSYFIKLFLSFEPSWESEQAEEYFNDLMGYIIKAGTKKGTKKSAVVEAQEIMRLAAEKIHGAFRELKQDSIETTAEFVLAVMNEALRDLVDLSYDDNDDEDVSKLFRIRNRDEKDAKVLKEYDVLG